MPDPPKLPGSPIPAQEFLENFVPHAFAEFAAGRRLPETDLALGFQLEGERSRWLTHEEISSGIIEALERQASRSIVGVVEPWEMRP